MKHSAIIALVAATALLAGCSKTQKVSSTYAYAKHETTCMGINHDGSETLRAWGNGPTKADAIEQARKNAVYDVIFKGIKTGDCVQAPIVNEVNARDRYANYFNPFFAVGGEYRNFAVVETGAKKPYIEAKGTNQSSWGVVVTVDREALKAQLKADGVIPENAY